MSLHDKPMIDLWASDSVYGVHGQAWDGSANKIEPSSGYKDEGLKPGDRPDAPEWNWWRNEIAKTVRVLASLQLANWKEASKTAGAVAALGSAQVRCVCFDRSLDAFTILLENGYTVYSYHPNDGAATPAFGGGGYAWDDEGTQNPNSRGWTANNIAIASNQNGQRVVVNTGQNNQVLVSSALNTWGTGTTTASAGYFWYDIDHDKSGLYVIVGTSGRINSSPDGATWTQRTSGVSDGFVAVRHSYDSNNSYWLALSPTRACRSADGITWAQNTHLLGSTPANKCLAYSKKGARWGTVGQNGRFYYSENNGQTWSYIAPGDPFGIGPGPITGLEKMNLECDGEGNWVFDYADGTALTPDRRWVSRDNGDTWHEIYDGLNSAGDLMRVHWGDDLFVAAGRNEIYTSLRLIGD